MATNSSDPPSTSGIGNNSSSSLLPPQVVESPEYAAVVDAITKVANLYPELQVFGLDRILPGVGRTALELEESSAGSPNLTSADAQSDQDQEERGVTPIEGRTVAMRMEQLQLQQGQEGCREVATASSGSATGFGIEQAGQSSSSSGGARRPPIPRPRHHPPPRPLQLPNNYSAAAGLPPIPSTPPPPYDSCMVDVAYPKTVNDVKLVLEQYFQYQMDAVYLNREEIYLMRILSIEPRHTYRYVLDTVLENRIIHTSSNPSCNMDDVADDPPPSQQQTTTTTLDRWSIPVDAPQGFPDNRKKDSATISLKEFDQIIQCLACRDGFVTCGGCAGKGFGRCTVCNGNIMYRKKESSTKYSHCTSCTGIERPACRSCRGGGRAKCRLCNGHGLRRHTQRLKVNWTTETQYYETKVESLTRHHLQRVRSGVILIEKVTKPGNIQPLTCPGNRKIGEMAKQLVGDWINKRQTEYSRVIRFRERLGLIPVVKVGFELYGKVDHFWIYGKEQLVYFPNGAPMDHDTDCCAIC